MEEQDHNPQSGKEVVDLSGGTILYMPQDRYSVIKFMATLSLDQYENIFL